LKIRRLKCPRDSSRGRAMRLVSAGVALICDQHQASAGRCWFGSCWLAERAEYSKNCDVGGKDPEADGGDYGEAEDDRHQKRNHGRKVLLFNLLNCSLPSCSVVRCGVFNLACVDAPR